MKPNKCTGGPVRDEKSARQRDGRGVERLDLHLLAAAHASGGVPRGRPALERGGASSKGEGARVRTTLSGITQGIAPARTSA